MISLAEVRLAFSLVTRSCSRIVNGHSPEALSTTACCLASDSDSGLVPEKEARSSAPHPRSPPKRRSQQAHLG
jgi:hypothetical protein